ncbi:hypothetical protein KQX54_012980 [Cotesia glomerata]|uniref:Uncharacterized protein n=1 Tax=Cotesia glomerata TaxID=32391 RepID=A0AAV7IZ52_COTGL|nr:hypothetical protein KQX54_012980 [Cotesia glomerata]
MAHYQSTCDKLKDSTPTQKFIDLVSNLILVMSSSIPRDALYVKDDCRQRQIRLVIKTKNNQKLRNCRFLWKNITRLSFGSTIMEIGTMTKLSASSFSLIRPPSGCNVSGKDLLRNLIEAKHVLTASDTQGKDSWLESIDEMLESPRPLDESSSTDIDHDYNQAVTSDVVQSYIAGYIVRKLRKTIKCEICLEAIETHAKVGKQLQRNDVINKMDLYGGLRFSSNQLFDPTKQLKNCVLRAVSKNLTDVETINGITMELRKEIVFKIECFQHENWEP